MKQLAIGVSALALSAAAAQAGGIERTTQSAMVLFETGNHFEFSLGHASPGLTGTDVAGVDIDNVGNDFWLPSMALKMDINDRLAFAVIYDRPFGADIEYGSETPVLGGTSAYAQTHALTALLKYSFDGGVSVFGGLRHQSAEGVINLMGAAYGTTPGASVSGYEINLDKTWGTGYVAGIAYEKPEIALRVALTYNSAITHDMDTTESGPLIGADVTGDGIPDGLFPLLNGTSTTEVKTPESWNLEFQTGIAQDTLLFGSIRHVKHSQFRVDPDQLELVTGSGLIDLEDTTTYRLGIGRRFNEKFAGSISVAYEAPGDDLVSPLAPSTGYTQLAIGGSYNITDNVILSGGASYTWLGDAKPETGTPDVARADFDNNDAFGIGFKVAFKF